MHDVILALNAKDLQNALVQGMVQGEQAWLVSTLAAFLPGLWTLSLMLHVGRPYMVRMVRKLTLRFAADAWWLSYVLFRDSVMVVTFALSFVYFIPNFARNIPLPITGPLAGIFMFWALLVKLTGDVDDNPRDYRLSTAFLVGGAALWLVPELVAIESTSQSFWAPVAGALTSTNHPDVATGILAAAVVLLVLTAAYVFNFVIGAAPDAAAKPKRSTTAGPAAVH